MDKVIFRKFPDGDVIAIFPRIMGDSNPYRTCLCYQQIGQHGAITLDFARFTKPAQVNEYTDLYNELCRIGYELKVSKRYNHKSDLKARLLQA